MGRINCPSHEIIAVGPLRAQLAVQFSEVSALQLFAPNSYCLVSKGTSRDYCSLEPRACFPFVSCISYIWANAFCQNMFSVGECKNRMCFFLSSCISYTPYYLDYTFRAKLPHSVGNDDVSKMYPFEIGQRPEQSRLYVGCISTLCDRFGEQRTEAVDV